MSDRDREVLLAAGLVELLREIHAFSSSRPSPDLELGTLLGTGQRVAALVAISRPAAGP
jgi:hypothetical protein